ncbi:DoxX family protein [Streptomyces sp. NPDC096176]|uniref:DoxX family protein n=1 Tax=Streptomyces sp. NPDC096176 TaxID=3366079 RepID=UPI0037F5929A
MSSPQATMHPTTNGYGSTSAAYDVGLLLLRVVLGLAMAAHGAQKLFGWFDGPGLTATGEAFSASGYPAGQVMAVVAALSETLGGLGLAVGLFTPLAAAAVVGVMINAIAVKWGGGFFSPKGIEFELLILTAAASLALTGPGRLAADHFLPVLRRHRLVHGLAAVALGVVTAVIVLLVRE